MCDLAAARFSSRLSHRISKRIATASWPQGNHRLSCPRISFGCWQSIAEVPGLPFDLMIGVNRQVYQAEVYPGRDLFDCRYSLIMPCPALQCVPRGSVPGQRADKRAKPIRNSWSTPGSFPTSFHAAIGGAVQHPGLHRAGLAGPTSTAYPSTSNCWLLLGRLQTRVHSAQARHVSSHMAATLARDFVEPRGSSTDRALELGHAILRGNGERIFGDV